MHFIYHLHSKRIGAFQVQKTSTTFFKYLKSYVEIRAKCDALYITLNCVRVYKMLINLSQS